MRNTALATFLAVVVAVSTVVFGASAFTAATVTRSASVDVVADDTGIVGLDDGTSGGLVYQKSTGVLTIDFGNSSRATGVNAAAHFELGNPADPTNQTAFNVTNNGGSTVDFTFKYTGSDGQDTDANVEFRIYNGTGSKVATVTEESGSDSVTVTGVEPGETLYVVVVVDTNGLDTGADLSGDFEIEV